MKHPRLAISAMAAVHLLLLVLLLLFWKPREGPLWIDYSCFAFLFSQGYLLGLWAALGGRPTPWRAISLVIVAATWGWFVHYQKGDYSLAISFATIVLLGQTFQVMGILLLARFMGLRLDKGEYGNENPIRHLQFSIGQALSWMTALAVFMGATHYLDCLNILFIDSDVSLPVSFFAMGLAATWLMCGSRWIVLRCFTPLLLIGLGTAWIIPVEHIAWWEGVTLLGCEAVMTAASLVVVRLTGYRLVWHWPFRRQKA